MLMDNIYNHYNNIIYFDTETTGFDSVNDRIIELSFISTNKDNFYGGFFLPQDIYVKTQVPQEITELTGISQQMLDEQGVSEQIMVEKLAQFIPTEHKNLLVAHNAQFDIGFIREAFKRCGKESLIDDCDYLDTLTVYKDRRPYPHKLANAIQAYELSNVRNSHLAKDDTNALFAVCKAMASERDDLDTYINIFGYNAKYGVSGEMIGKVKYYPQGYIRQMTAPNHTLPALFGKAVGPEPETIHINAYDLPVKEEPKDMSETRIVVKGEIDSYDTFKKTMDRLFPSGNFTIVHGGENKGVDVFADQYAQQMQVKKVVFKPKWEKFQRRAGHVRNSTMLKYASEANGYFVTFGPNEALERQAERKGIKVIKI
ncbi:MAG: DUF2493 domain-containing protein [Erysipelotrichaceae bacterium]|nr:DUF2493 domain-containing protein [Erysipelotrichaceae bacterium]